MRSQCYLPPDTSERALRLTPASQAGTPLTYPGGTEGRVDLGGWLYSIPRWFTCEQTVTHPSSNRARCRETTLIKTNLLSLHHADQILILFQ